MKTGPILGIVLAASLASTIATAQPGRGGERFAEHDTDGDGTITRAEVEAQIASHFAEADEDGDGTLSQDEAIAFHQARREDRHDRRREHRRGEQFGHHAGDDDVIDLAEFSQRGMQRFEMADLDENGQVTETEMQIVAGLMERRHGRHDGRHEDRHDEHRDD